MLKAGWLVVGVLVAATMAAGPTKVAAKGGDFQCTGTETSTTISGNIVVPGGAFCDLEGTHVTGNATVQPTGGLLSDNGSRIDGDVHVQRDAQFAQFGGSSTGRDVQCDRCQVADSQNSTIGGNLHDNGISQGAFLLNNHIGGDLMIDHGMTVSGGPFDIENNAVGGNLTFNHNTGTSTISGNAIVNNLECIANSPPPSGAGNTASQKKGQCAGL